MTTSEAALVVSRALKVPLSARDVDYITRAWPVDELPPIQGGKRDWSAPHIARLQAAVATRLGGR